MGHKSMQDRFWEKTQTDPESECILWTGAKHESFHKGQIYGSFFISKGKTEAAHRMAYLLAIGDIPSGTEVVHDCGNTLCVNPAHLILGNPQIRVRISSEKHKTNTPHGEQVHTAKITHEIAHEVRERLSRGESVKAIARQYEVSDQTVYDIRNGVRWNG